MSFPKLLCLLALTLSLSATSALAGGDHDDHPGYGGPGFGPAPGYCPPGFNPGFPPPPPGFYPAPGYMFTCFAQNNFGAWFYAMSPNPSFAQAQAMQFCAMTGGYCVPTGCR